MKENSIVRENLMTRQGYRPYCGKNHCSQNMPRTKYDSKLEQFTCGCGWVSEFQKDFINRYKQKWGK